MARARRDDQYKIKTVDGETIICEFEALEIDEVNGTVDHITKQIKLNATNATPYAEIEDLAEAAITDWID